MNIGVIEQANYIYENYRAIVETELRDLYPPIPKRLQGIKFQEVRNSKENPKIGRNTPCNCGSGKKYKKCCIK